VDLLEVWLDTLKDAGFAPEGPVGKPSGTIQSVIESSAILCSRFESGSYQREHHDRNQDQIILDTLTVAGIEELRGSGELDQDEPANTADGLKQPRELRDQYLAQFPEKVKILDICWAAGEHYREWKRWINEELKTGSKPDRGFRAILSSGKRPIEYRTKKRPDGWQ